MQEINLLKARQGISEKKLALIRKTRVVSFIGLAIYCLLVGGLFSFLLILQGQESEIERKIDVQKRRITQLKEVETMHVFLKQRLSNLVSFYDQGKIDYPEVITQLEALLPDQVELNSFDMNEEGKLNLRGEAANAVVLADFFNRVLSPTNDEIAQRAELSSASRQGDGSYSFSLSLDVEI